MVRVDVVNAGDRPIRGAGIIIVEQNRRSRSTVKPVPAASRHSGWYAVRSSLVRRRTVDLVANRR